MTGGYFFDETKEYGHCRPVRWLKVFEKGKTLPVEGEGKLTTFYELKTVKIYATCILFCTVAMKLLMMFQREDPVEQIRPISFNTGLISDQPRNSSSLAHQAPVRVLL